MMKPGNGLRWHSMKSLQKLPKEDARWPSIRMANNYFHFMEGKPPREEHGRLRLPALFGQPARELLQPALFTLFRLKEFPWIFPFLNFGRSLHQTEKSGLRWQRCFPIEPAWQQSNKKAFPSRIISPSPKPWPLKLPIGPMTKRTATELEPSASCSMRLSGESPVNHLHCIGKRSSKNLWVWTSGLVYRNHSWNQPPL